MNSFWYIATFTSVEDVFDGAVEVPLSQVRRFFIQRPLVYFTSLPESKSNLNSLHQASFLQSSPEKSAGILVKYRIKSTFYYVDVKILIEVHPIYIKQVNLTDIKLK